jgi:hypothetical protein
MPFYSPTDLLAVPLGPTGIHLTWTPYWSEEPSNPDAPQHHYASVDLYRSTNGGAWELIGEWRYQAAFLDSWTDWACQDGTSYNFILFVGDWDSIATDWSNESAAITPLTAPGSLSGSAGPTSVYLEWVDYCQNESGFKIYQDGVLAATLGANVISHTITGLTQGRVYNFRVTAYNAITESVPSNTIDLLTENPPAKPSNLVATVTATTKGRLNWLDNSDVEVDYHIEQSSTSATAGFTDIAQVGENIITYEVTGLTSNTQYWFRVRAENSSGFSSYSNVATMVTLAAIAAPTNLVCIPISGTVMDIYFDDNSELEDFHCVERKDSGAYSEIVQLQPNRNCYRNTGLTTGTVYTYQVRAKQGASSYSTYCAEVAATTLSVPGNPTSGSFIAVQDTSIELYWRGPYLTTETGCRLERSDTGSGGTYNEIAVIGRGLEYVYVGGNVTLYRFLDTGLTPGHRYDYRVRAYNGAGNSGYHSLNYTTTLLKYPFSKFEKLIRKQNPLIVYLVEINPLIVLAGWALSDGQTYTYETTFDERGSAIIDAFENGAALIGQLSIANTESNAGSWYYDPLVKKVYVHPTSADSPADYLITGSFWMYLTNWQKSETIFNEHYYLPLVAADGIPDISQEMQPYYEGNFVITSGSLSLINGAINKWNYFDRKFEKYIFLNRKAKTLAGGEGFTYQEFKTINTGIINSQNCTDQRTAFELRDYRDGINRTVPYNKYFPDEFVNIDENSEFKIKPYGYGVITNAVPICIDTVNRVFSFHDGRIKSVQAVTQNGSTLTVNTDYFIDYQRGRIVLARGLAYTASDIILINFTGAVDSADDVIATGAAIFRDIMNNFLNIPDAELDLTSIWSTHLAKTTALSLYLWKEIDSQELMRRIERSIQADTFQTAEGKIGIKPQITTAPSNVAYIPNAHIFDFSMEKSGDSIFNEINVYYSEDSSTDKFQCVNRQVPSAVWKYGISKPLDIYTALASEAEAISLAAAIVSLLDKAIITFTVPRTLFCHLPGDLIYLTRSRYFNSSGAANKILLRILSISKNQSGGRTTITAEEV